jgi:hypothetical protein
MVVGGIRSPDVCVLRLDENRFIAGELREAVGAVNFGGYFGSCGGHSCAPGDLPKG